MAARRPAGTGSPLGQALVLAVLAGFVAAVYAAVALAGGAALSGDGSPGLAASVAATAIVAVCFERVRAWAARLAGRLGLGGGPSPYDLLARFSARVAAVGPTGSLLPRLVEVVGDGVGATRVEMWLSTGQELWLAAAWPAGRPGSAPPRLALDAGEPPAIPGMGRVLAVRHQGELLGALAVAKPAAEPLSPLEERLLGDLAGQAGLAVAGERLAAELGARVGEVSATAAELRASRARVVAAHDAERRRLERDIHDGAQQHLVALAVKLRLAATLALRAPERATAVLAELRAAVAAVRRTLAGLAGGVYPAPLAERGLVAAVRAWADEAAGPVEVRAAGVGRFHPDVEAAVWFCCLEALQNVAKHAGAGRVVVSLFGGDGALRFEVSDDGAGFDPAAALPGTGLQGLADRLAALGGRLELHSAPGRGTTVTGRVPVDPRERVP
jgi:signal transduction histidine kinase